MKIYVAGKITGLENFEAKFKEAVEKLESIGHTVLSPAVLSNGFEQDEYMHICYAMIDVCDGVYFLDNWRDSKGARLEHEYAEKNKKIITFQ